MMVLQLFVMLLTKVRFFRVMGRIAPGNTMRKRLILSQLKGIGYAELDRLAAAYYRTCIRPALIPMMKERLLRHVEAGDSVWIVSGGYDIYIEYFVVEFGLAGSVSTKIAFSDKGMCLGRFDGIDCMGENKVRLLKERALGPSEDAVTTAYSDSISDLPLLTMADHGYVVSNGRSQAWCGNNGLKELIWE